MDLLPIRHFMDPPLTLKQVAEVNERMARLFKYCEAHIVLERLETVYENLRAFQHMSRLREWQKIAAAMEAEAGLDKDKH
jgi:hypothetical protein